MRRKQMPLWQELPLLLLVAFCLAVLIRTFLVQAFFIPSGSMEHTLEVGDRVLVNKVVYDMREPLHGEVVVFRGDKWVPEGPVEAPLGFSAKLSRTIGDLVGVSRPGEKDFIKRVIGLPGDRVSCCDAQGRILLNGQPVNEPYIQEADNSPLDLPPGNECRSRRFAEVVVGPGQMWVMGDHRLVSQDSRCQGQVPIKDVIGRAFVIVWPKKSWEQLPIPPSWQQVPSTARRNTALPAQPAPTGRETVPASPDGFAVALPMLLSWGASARSRPLVWHRRRRLRP
jgi:signal peptidase I